MGISEIRDAMESAIVARGCFIVGIKITNDNEIVLTIESERGTVTLDDCMELSRVFEEKFSRDTEDYGLTVTSAGLDQAWWTGITVAAMLCLFLVIQSVVMAARKKGNVK